MGANAIPTIDLGTWRTDPASLAAQVGMSSGNV